MSKVASPSRQHGLLFAVTILGILGARADARAATLCVNPGGTGGCFATIQAAVDAAAAGDIVDIAAGTYVESVAMPRKRLTLHGAGPSATIIDGNGAFAVLRFDGFNGSLVAIENLGVRNGDNGIWAQAAVTLRLTDCAVADNRSGIYLNNRVKVLMTRCTVTGNFARGGISLNYSSRLTMVQSAVTGNTFDPLFGDGVGGIDATGKLTVIDSTVADNGSSGSGGGIQSTFGTLTVSGSTISGNSSAAHGGGIHLGTVTGTVKISNSTISGNTAATDGGGIYVDAHRRLSLDHVTIAGNTATTGRGGGLYARATITGTNKPTALRASVIADNAATSEPDCSADRVLARDGNLVENPTGCAVSALGGSPLISADPLLGPLQNNGGPTKTQALGGGSAAIGVVTSVGGCKSPDQRGIPRSVPCDLGAYEAP